MNVIHWSAECTTVGWCNTKVHLTLVQTLSCGKAFFLFRSPNKSSWGFDHFDQKSSTGIPANESWLEDCRVGPFIKYFAIWISHLIFQDFLPNLSWHFTQYFYNTEILHDFLLNVHDIITNFLVKKAQPCEFLPESGDLRSTNVMQNFVKNLIQISHLWRNSCASVPLVCFVFFLHSERLVHG